MAACSDDEPKQTPPLTFSISEDYIGDNNKMWIYISDHSGNVLGVQEAHDNTTLTFNMPEGFTESTVMLNVFNYYDMNIGGDNNLLRMQTHYAHVKPGDYRVSGKDLTMINPPSVVGGASITITNMTDGYQSLARGVKYESFGNYISDNAYVVSVKMYEEQSDVVVALHNENGTSKYKLITNVKVGDELTISLNDFKSLDKTSVGTPDASYAYSLQGALSSDQFIDIHFYNDYNIRKPTDASSINLYSPAQSPFTWYLGYATENTGTTSNSYYNYGPSPITSFKRSDAELGTYTVEGNKIEIDISGGKGYDMLLNGSVNTTIDDRNVGDVRGVFMPFNAKTDFTLPALPAEIANQYYPDGLIIPAFNSLLIEEDLLMKRTYDDVINDRFNYEAVSTETFNTYESVTRYFQLGDNGGRLSSPDYNLSFDMLPDFHRQLLKQATQRFERKP
jgi:hypothetical protein